LEVGCGTGKFLNYLRKKYHFSGVDLSEGMLKVARKKFHHMMLKKMDMTNLTLGKKFDVIVCLFSSIGYVKTLPRLKKTISGFARHLNKGGVLIIEPWLNAQTYHAGNPHGNLYKSKELVVARVSVSERKGMVSVMDMHHLIARKGGKVEHVIEHHELGLFPVSTTLDYLREAGLDARFHKDGLQMKRGLYVATKPL
ncbi:MAG: class I SAM-dependent methyltransferase, partial [archaeon]